MLLWYNPLMDKVLLVFSAVAFVILLSMMLLFSPSEVGPFGVLVFFILCYVLFLGLAVLCCRLFFVLRGRLDKTKSGNSKKKSYYYGLVIALAPILLLVCSSFGGLSFLQIFLVFGLEVMLCFLVSRNIV